MQRVQGFYLYQVGSQLHPLADIVPGRTTWNEAYFPLTIAEGALEPLITRSIFQLRTSVQAGGVLLQHIREAKAAYEELSADEKNDSMPPFSAWGIQAALNAFEAVLEAECSLIPLYVVTPKSGMVLTDLIDNGSVCFPQDLVLKVPEALDDVSQATKCIAFDLPTAAGFHLHRANEAVLRVYFAHVAPDLKPPKNRNMGEYLKKLSDHGRGDPKVIAVLTQLKDLHRNPLMHPDERLANVEEAITVMGAVRAAMSEMLKACSPVGFSGAPQPFPAALLSQS